MQEPFIQRAGYNATPKKQEEDSQASQDDQPKTAEDVAKKGAADALGEAGLSPDEEKNDLRERLQRERQERVMKKELKDFARKQSDPASHARDTNLRLREESVTRTSKQLEAPKASVTQVSEKSPSTEWKSIEIVVVDNGQFKKGKFYISGELTAI